MPAVLSQFDPPGEAGVESCRAIRRVTFAGLLVNLVLFALKLGLGVLGRSQAVIADAFHTLADVSTDIAVLVGARYWTAPPDREHPFGHGRIETMITLAIGLVVAFSSLAIGWRAAESLRDRRTPVPELAALGGAVLSMIVKEALYRWTARRGRALGSPALRVNAWHHRMDALSSAPAALAVLLARIVPGGAFLDGIGALVVAVICIRAAWGILAGAVQDLTDTAVDAERVRAIERTARQVQGVRDVHALRTRRSGGSVYMDIHVLVDPNLTVEAGHAIAETVKQRLLQADLDVADCVVHVEPYSRGPAQRAGGGPA